MIRTISIMGSAFAIDDIEGVWVRSMPDGDTRVEVKIRDESIVLFGGEGRALLGELVAFDWIGRKWGMAKANKMRGKSG